MQGQRGKMVSLPETFEIDRASSSTGAAIDQPVCWNEMRGPSESHFPGFMLSTNETAIPFSIGQEQHNVNDWNLGEASSSNGYRSNNGEWKVEGGWTTNVGRHGPMIEDQRYGASSGALSLDNALMHPMFVPGSASSSIPLNLNSVGDYGGPNIENPPLMEYSNLYKTNGSNINRRFPTPTGSQVDPSVPLGTSGFVREDGAVRLGGPLDGRRVPCKRKSIEGHVGGQSSIIESPNFTQPMESSSWHANPPCLNMNAVPTSQQLPEHLGRGLGLNLAGGSVGRGVLDTENPESLHRNFRLRVNSSGHNDMRSTPLSSSAMASNGSPGVILAPQSSSRVAVANRSLELPPPSAFSGSASHAPHSLVQVPVMVPGGHSVRWARVVPRNNSSSSGTVLPGEATSSGSSRNVLQHSMFASSLSSSARGHVNASSSSFGGNVDSTRVGSSASAAPQLPHHSLAPQPNHQQSRYPRRLTELVRRQLLSSIGSNSEGAQSGQTSNSAGRGVPPHDVLLSSGQNATSHRHSLARSGIWMGRQGDSVVGFPYPMRTLSASEGRRRLASEIRSVLELVRRGEGNIRFEDVMILDPAMLWGVADMHDRHRDMRLDVDNMSYEELLALEERIGNVSTGLNEETILARMKQRKHSNVENTQMEAEPCCICQEEYNDGEDLGTLECGHDFHRDCIKQWLMQKNLCPICKTTGLST